MNRPNRKKKLTYYLIGVLAFFVMSLVLIKGFSIGRQVVAGETTLSSAMIYGSGIIVSICLIFAGWITNHRVSSLEGRQAWLINVVNWNVKQLRDHGLDQVIETREEPHDTELKSLATQWPWGEHHTVYLGHLDAAARKWWNLYDPADPTTAPTNEMVSDWLQSERNLSKERARAIASMLRPDNLPTGPRK